MDQLEDVATSERDGLIVRLLADTGIRRARRDATVDPLLADRNLRWHLYDLVAPSHSLTDLLKEVARPDRHPLGLATKGIILVKLVR